MNGIKVWEMSQTPFGIATVNEDVDGDGITVENNFRFPGQYYDAETGLNYNYFRTYDPALGRYTQHDPIGLAGGLNTFGYVGGDPVFWIDSLGLWSEAAHNYFVDQTYSNSLTPKQRQAVKAGSRFADSSNFQGSNFSHMHGMSSPKFNKSMSRKRYEAFLRQQKKAFCNLLKEGDEDRAYFELGMGLHAIMDSTSPLHRQFQPWNVNVRDVSTWGQVFGHGPFFKEGIRSAKEGGYTKETSDKMNQYFPMR